MSDNLRLQSPVKVCHGIAINVITARLTLPSPLLSYVFER